MIHTNAKWLSGEEVRPSELTTEQWEAIDRLLERHDNIHRDPIFIHSGFGYIGVVAGSLFIGIETDGHCHT